MNLLNDLPDELINMIYKHHFNKIIKFINYCEYCQPNLYRRLEKYIEENKE